MFRPNLTGDFTHIRVGDPHYEIVTDAGHKKTGITSIVTNGAIGIGVFPYKIQLRERMSIHEHRVGLSIGSGFAYTPIYAVGHIADDVNTYIYNVSYSITMKSSSSGILVLPYMGFITKASWGAASVGSKVPITAYNSLALDACSSFYDGSDQYNIQSTRQSVVITSSADFLPVFGYRIRCYGVLTNITFNAHLNINRYISDQQIFNPNT